MVEKIYANMSACHIKNENWQRALDTANKVGWKLAMCSFTSMTDHRQYQALAKNESNYKAMFRKGKALGELGYFEKAEKVLEELKTKNPTGEIVVMKHSTSRMSNKMNPDAAGVTAELSRLRAIDQAREKANKQKLKGASLCVSTRLIHLKRRHSCKYEPLQVSCPEKDRKKRPPRQNPLHLGLESPTLHLAWKKSCHPE